MLLVFAFLAITAFAQNDDYNEFRQQMLNDYNGYRRGILDNYAKFLDTVWKDYTAFKGESLFPGRKPKTIPVAPKIDDTPFSVIPSPDNPVTPTPCDPVDIKPETPTPVADGLSFRFYTVMVNAPKIDVPHLSGVSEKEIGRLWSEFQKRDICSKISASLQQTRMACNLNDWLTFVLVRRYTDAVYGEDVNSSLVLSHYILTNMGYNVRIGKNSNGHVLLLVPFRQNIYERQFLKIDGVRYYIFFEDTNKAPENSSIGSVYTCDLPQGTDYGKSFNLVLKNPVLPSDGYKEYYKSYDTITLKGKVPNVAIMIAKDYPLTDVQVYASSSLSPEFRKNLLDQVSSQIQGLSEYDAVAKILSFIQHAFNYKTDWDQFGFEKAFYVEENFYYPYNDCEDRAILLAFLVCNLLNLDVHLLYYPGHEATAIRFSDQTIKGDGYIYQNGNRYIICDPTYIGAGVGQCMPEYENVKPKVELW